MSKLKISLYGIAHHFIETENYRMLSAHEYCWAENPLRSSRDRNNQTTVSFLLTANASINNYFSK